MRQKCRIWWPKELTCSKPSFSTVLFGWVVSCFPISLDIVVAFACDEATIIQWKNDLKAVLHDTNGSLPMFLQETTIFSIVGHCAEDSNCNGPRLRGINEDRTKPSSHFSESVLKCQDSCLENCGLHGCGCHRIDGLLKQSLHDSIENHTWIQLYESREFSTPKKHWIPKFHHIHQNGRTVSNCDLHVIIYETPRFGSHHFSLGFRNSSEQVRSLTKTKWVNELHQKQPILNLDAILIAINSVVAADVCFKRYVGYKEPCFRFPIATMLGVFMWKLFCISISFFSTLFYIILQYLHRLSYKLKPWVFITLTSVFRNTYKIIQIRCCHILYWPIFLRDYGLRSQSCVEYAEKITLRKHVMWSTITVDVLLGSLIGLALLCYAESTCLWISNFINEITNNLLRTGCVWLMGVPAGFKLNTELARILGMISLNVIQIWSTLWFFVGFCFIYFLKGLAISGILMGITIPGAIIIDMISIATLHISTLHWMISLLYSHQIQALASLWRLFRGRKWNPFRNRLDSYHYTVKQHIVGSLLFTPLLLLLPTTSVFYIFFTIMSTCVSLTCLVIEITISIIHTMPYTKIILWLVRRRRFPSGIWYEILSCQSNQFNLLDLGKYKETGLPSDNSQDTTNVSRSNLLVSVLHSNFLNLGQIVLPQIRQVFCGISGPFVISLAHGVLIGRRIPYTLGFLPPLQMPWMFIPVKEYWRLCHDSTLACMENCHNYFY